MALDKITVVSGLPGLYRMAGARNNGMIVEEIDTGKRKFLSSRKYNFSPLETISVFTMQDALPLVDVLHMMDTCVKGGQQVCSDDSDEQLRAFFTAAVPDHDPYRVSARDIKKMVKWYEFLVGRDLLQATTNDDSEEE